MEGRYVFLDTETVFKHDIVGINSGRRVSLDGKIMCLLEDDLLRVGKNTEDVAKELGAQLVGQKEAIKIIKKQF